MCERRGDGLDVARLQALGILIYSGNLKGYPCVKVILLALISRQCCMHSAPAAVQHLVYTVRNKIFRVQIFDAPVYLQLKEEALGLGARFSVAVTFICIVCAILLMNYA